MSSHAFIFTSRADLHAARLLASHLRASHWQATVAIHHTEAPDKLGPCEITTWFPRQGNLNGVECVTGILETMRDSSSRVLVKLDADMRLTQAGAQWLKNASAESRGFPLGVSPWIGAWAIPAERLETAINLSRSPGICRTCGESKISHWILRNLGPIAAAPPSSVQVWRTGRAVREDSFLLTLPSLIATEKRALDIAMLQALEL